MREQCSGRSRGRLPGARRGRPVAGQLRQCQHPRRRPRLSPRRPAPRCAACAPTDLSVVGLDGEQLGGEPVTKELGMHLAAYAARPEVRAVVHLHSRAATAVSCLEIPDGEDPLPPYTPYRIRSLGSVGLVPYAAPGSAELTRGGCERGRPRPTCCSSPTTAAWSARPICPRRSTCARSSRRRPNSRSRFAACPRAVSTRARPGADEGRTAGEVTPGAGLQRVIRRRVHRRPHRSRSLSDIPPPSALVAQPTRGVV